TPFSPTAAAAMVKPNTIPMHVHSLAGGSRAAEFGRVNERNQCFPAVLRRTQLNVLQTAMLCSALVASLGYCILERVVADRAVHHPVADHEHWRPSRSKLARELHVATELGLNLR